MNICTNDLQLKKKNYGEIKLHFLVLKLLSCISEIRHSSMELQSLKGHSLEVLLDEFVSGTFL